MSTSEPPTTISPDPRWPERAKAFGWPMWQIRLFAIVAGAYVQIEEYRAFIRAYHSGRIELHPRDARTIQNATRSCDPGVWSLSEFSARALFERADISPFDYAQKPLQGDVMPVATYGSCLGCGNQQLIDVETRRCHACGQWALKSGVTPPPVTTAPVVEEGSSPVEPVAAVDESNMPPWWQEARAQGWGDELLALKDHEPIHIEGCDTAILAVNADGSMVVVTRRAPNDLPRPATSAAPTPVPNATPATVQTEPAPEPPVAETVTVERAHAVYLSSFDHAIAEDPSQLAVALIMGWDERQLRDVTMMAGTHTLRFSPEFVEFIDAQGNVTTQDRLTAEQIDHDLALDEIPLADFLDAQTHVDQFEPAIDPVIDASDATSEKPEQPLEGMSALAMSSLLSEGDGVPAEPGDELDLEAELVIIEPRPAWVIEALAMGWTAAQLAQFQRHWPADTVMTVEQNIIRLSVGRNRHALLRDDGMADRMRALRESSRGLKLPRHRPPFGPSADPPKPPRVWTEAELAPLMPRCKPCDADGLWRVGTHQHPASGVFVCDDWEQIHPNGEPLSVLLKGPTATPEAPTTPVVVVATVAAVKPRKKPAVMPPHSGLWEGAKAWVGVYARTSLIDPAPVGTVVAALISRDGKDPSTVCVKIEDVMENIATLHAVEQALLACASEAVMVLFDCDQTAQTLIHLQAEVFQYEQPVVPRLRALLAGRLARGLSTEFRRVTSLDANVQRARVACAELVGVTLPVLTAMPSPSAPPAAHEVPAPTAPTTQAPAAAQPPAEEPPRPAFRRPAERQQQAFKW